jgi:MoxR-like ATPase
MSADAIKDDLEQFRTDFRRLRQEIGKVVVGQDDIVEGTLAALGGFQHHVRAHQVGRRFEFQKGPVFANIVLADEINRATPKTQSALLEAMQEHGVTVGGQTYPLPEPFFVLATQNPLEMEGTYPLPEAQLDRFFFKLLVQFPKFMETILDRTTESKKPKAEPIFDGSRILSLAQLVRLIPVATEVRRFAIAVVMATHPEHELATTMTRQYVRYGSSPRGAQSIILAAKLKAILDGRFHVAREDIKAVAPMALRHRLILNFEGQAEGVPADAVVENILKSVKEPVTVA